MMNKLRYLPLALVFSCAVAGIYGALHNQVSYTVSPHYFHEFKFIQFDIATDHHNRLGASIVGFLASWWMGLIIGLPLYLVAMFIKDMDSMLRSYLKATCLVVIVAFATGLGALVTGYMSYGPDNLPVWMHHTNYSDPVAFARAGHMHNLSYLGGFFGLKCGVIYLIFIIIRARLRSEDE